MVFSKIKTILVEEFDIDEENISLDSSFTEDLDFDDIDIVDFVMSCEDAFEKEIPLDMDDDSDNYALGEIKTIDDLVKFISEI